MSKVLLLDIETSPIVALVWGVWETNVSKMLQDYYILCVAYKWEGKKMQFIRSHKNGDDKAICAEMSRLFNEADVIIAQNGDQFDLKKINARLAFHGFPPPHPYKTIDTLKILKRNFGLTRNSLDFVCKYFGFGSKTKHDGIDMWDNCMNHPNHPDWKVMEKYNKQDVLLLEKLYHKIKPWHKTLPKIDNVCIKCKSPKGHWRGWEFSNGLKLRRWQCNDCGKRYMTDIKYEN